MTIYRWDPKKVGALLSVACGADTAYFSSMDFGRVK
jgi:hypothetical protein